MPSLVMMSPSPLTQCDILDTVRLRYVTTTIYHIIHHFKRPISQAKNIFCIYWYTVTIFLTTFGITEYLNSCIATYLNKLQLNNIVAVR